MSDTYDKCEDKPSPGMLAFLEELTALTLKHSLVISGCGCCGSPRIAAGYVTRPSSRDGWVTVAPKSGKYTVTDGDGENLTWEEDAPST